MDSFEGRATLIMGGLVQISNAATGRILFLPRNRIADSEALGLGDRVWIEGDPSHRRGRRLAPDPAPLTPA